MAEETQEDLNPVVNESAAVDDSADETPVAAAPANEAAEASGPVNETKSGQRGNRAQKIGVVASDKMQKTVVVRVDRLIKHPKYRRYVRRTSKFMAHDETGATI